MVMVTRKGKKVRVSVKKLRPAEKKKYTAYKTWMRKNH